MGEEEIGRKRLDWQMRLPSEAKRFVVSGAGNKLLGNGESVTAGSRERNSGGGRVRMGNGSRRNMGCLERISRSS